LYVLQARIYTADEPNKNTEIDEGKKNKRTIFNKPKKKNLFFCFFSFLVTEWKENKQKNME